MKKKYYFILLLLVLILIFSIYINIKNTELFEDKNTNLVYYTHGYNNKFLDMLDLSIKSLRIKNNNDIVIICDESFINDAKEKLKHYNNIYFHPVKDSKSAPEASMNKLKIFDYENINNYEKILFIDSDIIIHTDLNNIFNNINEDNLLYVKRESLNTEDHKNIYYSLQLYTEEQLDNFKRDNTFVFNAGQFGFINSEQMKTHFNNINNLIRNHKGESFYEQSFMNHYFNLHKLKNDDILDNNVRLFPENDVMYENKIIHFCGLGEGNPKFERMSNYFNKFILSN